MLERLERIAERLERRLKKAAIAGKPLLLNKKICDFTNKPTRSKTIPSIADQNSYSRNSEKNYCIKKTLQTFFSKGFFFSGGGGFLILGFRFSKLKNTVVRLLKRLIINQY